MLKQVSLTAIALCASLTMSAQAATIPYPDIGTPAPANSFVAEADGEITAYFFATSAGYTSRIGLWADGVQVGGYGLQNHSSSYGDSYVFGNVTAGAELVFELQVLTTSGSWYSLATSNSDGLNHTYATAWGGDGDIPAGTYIGFEDLPNLGDIDYNDHQFVFTNVKNTTVPEPFSLALFGLGVAALGFARKRAA
ncbi:MAG: DUF4114 domain-containing protein [Cellvibrio sp.]|uniref:DUF4114 domain-containing protein n=1 Tax=Cellvibrio sp. TaxID=1965322 RepID=UPI0031B45E88